MCRWFAVLAIASLGTAAGAEKALYRDEVAPILAARCVECHGPTLQLGMLRLDSAHGIAAGGEHGPVVIAGDPNASELLARVALPAADPKRMPASGPPLDAEQIAVLRRWIEAGAPMDGSTPPPEEEMPADDLLAGLELEPQPDAPTENFPAPTLSFNRDIRPILSNNCFQCHGPDGGNRMAGLRLDRREDAVAERDGGKRAIAPGAPARSELVKRITHANPAARMPPAHSEKRLTDRDIDLLQRWIAEGAHYEPHWAYIPPQRPAVPAVAAATWTRNPIDAFILAELERAQLAPAPEADRAVLLRRLSYDLLGLPPSHPTARAFLKDRRPDAYERLVDHLLASPHYGERMALDWLDLVRYADTNGFHTDGHRDVYPYRDYVIRAFNENKPFDVFTVEQLAGDLLPDAGDEQRIASGYNRMNQITSEGGAQPKEYLAKYASDRTRTTAAVWLGATLGCAECHDHKFDPFTAKDFYSFAAFFADLQEEGVYPGDGLWKPYISLPSPEQKQRMAALEQEIAGYLAELATPSVDLNASRPAWEESIRRELASEANDWTVLTPASVESREGMTLEVGADAVVMATGTKPEQDVFTLAFPIAQRGLTALRLEALMRARGQYNFVLTRVEVESATSAGTPVPVALAAARASHSQANYPVEAAIDADPGSGWAVDGHLKRADHEAVFVFAQPLSCEPGSTLTVRLKHESAVPHHILMEFRLSATTVAAPNVTARRRVPAEVLAAIEAPDAPRDATTQAAVAAYHKEVAPELDPTRTALSRAQQAKHELFQAIPRSLISAATAPRPMRILPRGNWLDESGPEVEPAIPAVFGALPVAGRASRLDLARWLVAADNPLTARVLVNRLWKRFYGAGLSRKLDDLGSQGEWPTHPELLDWLAVELIESGWNIKHIVRLMVASATYRQTSFTSELLRERDPDNRLLARQSAFRLPAELLRDNALAASGLLTPAIGGPSVKPYQPDGYWDNSSIFGQLLVYDTSTGPDQYRRGLYTYWKRSFVHPSMLIFDAPTREECVAERPTSNTPLQALVLLNDPTYVEAARVLAARIMREARGNPRARIRWAFERILLREPTKKESAVLENLYARHRAQYKSDPDAARALLTVGQAPRPERVDPAELAAWTSVARALLNLHETVTRS